MSDYSSIFSGNVMDHGKPFDSGFSIARSNEIFHSQGDLSDSNQIDNDDANLDVDFLPLSLDFLELDSPPEDEAGDRAFSAEPDPGDADQQDFESDAWVFQALGLEEFLEQQTTYQFSTHAIFEALCLSGGDLQQAAELVLAAKNTVDRCRPCRHMLTGKCYRSDCSYDHELSQVPCRYWMSPVGCAKWLEGQSCPFLHQLPSPYDHSHFYSAYVTGGSSSGGVTASASALSDADFPELTTSKKKGSQVQSVPSSSTAADRKKMTQSEADKIYQSMFNISTHSATATTVGSTDRSAAQSSSSEPRRVKLTKDEEQKWLWKDTGKAVSEEYSRYRQDARTHALNRNRLLTAASRAYLSGHRDEAAQLSQRGHEENVLMKGLHKQAAHAIFARRNTAEQLLLGHVDLHGLHAAEAAELLLELLPVFCPGACQSAGVDETIETDCINKALFTRIRAKALEHVLVVVGSGHHTKGGPRHSKLFESVKNFLTYWGFTFQVVKDANGFEGAFRISTRTIKQI